ncbi:MAG TPA: sensor histidine kinase [Verrucomicrobiae bacterium]|jgi:signal transduction histidine kinase
MKRRIHLGSLAGLPTPRSHSRQPAAAQLKGFIEILSQRTVELAASNLALSFEMAQHKAAEDALRQNERHYIRLLEKSARLQEQLRRLSRQVLSAQEKKRNQIGRKLHEAVARSLTEIHARLSELKTEAVWDTPEFGLSIARTQRLVGKSVRLVHQFARDLRPAVLDDLGLVAALSSCLKEFAARTGLRVQLTTFEGAEQLDAAERTALYRVVQESLANAARHAKASRVEVSLRKLPGAIAMRIKDDGRSFEVESAMRLQGSARLGLLGMRERVEMIGGALRIESAPGRGTTVLVEIPFTQFKN